jgi:DNA-binding NarL/FixJ family response regulator
MNILVLEGHAIYRQGLVAALAAAPELGAVHQAAAAAEAGELLDAVDVVLIDIDLDGTDELLRSLRARGTPRAIVCMSRNDQERVIACIGAGAIGFLCRETITPENLIAAVRAVAAGSGVLTPELLGGVFSRIADASRTMLEPRGLTFERLSPREREVLRLLADGLATREVARRMAYSERTVKSVLHDIVTKLGVNSRSQAIAFAVREGLI